ncbi:MAG: hypothetical protein ACXWU0_11255 [Rhodoplanes sp.]
MNETRIHDLLAQAYNLLAAELRSRHPTFDGPMDEMMRLFDPKGPFNTPTMTVSLDPVIDQAVRRCSRGHGALSRRQSRVRRGGGAGPVGRAQPAGSDR